MGEEIVPFSATKTPTNISGRVSAMLSQCFSSKEIVKIMFSSTSTPFLFCRPTLFDSSVPPLLPRVFCSADAVVIGSQHVELNGCGVEVAFDEALTIRGLQPYTQVRECVREIE